MEGHGSLLYQSQGIFLCAESKNLDSVSYCLGVLRVFEANDFLLFLAM